MKSFFPKIALLSLALLLACSNPFTSNDGEVVIDLDEPELKITNRLNQDIYYAVFDPDVAAVIDWIPTSTEDNRIKPDGSVVISTSDIEQHEVGDKVQVFYWTEDNEIFETEFVE